MSSLIGLLLAVSVTQQNLTRLVSAEVRAASAPVAVAELSKQIGFPLEAMPSTKKDILVVKVDKVSVKDLMAKVAATLNAEWEKTATGYRLFRNEQIQRKELAEELQKRTEAIRESLNDLKKRLQATPPFTQQAADAAAERLFVMHEDRNNNNWRELEQLMQTAPAFRVLEDIVLKLTPEVLASVPRGRRVVFSTSPTKMQKPMPFDIQASLGRFVASQKIWSRAVQRAKANRGRINYFFESNARDIESRTLGKTLLILQSPVEEGPNRAVKAQIFISDNKGYLLGEGNETIGWSWYRSRPANPLPPDPQEESMRFSGISAQIREAYQTPRKSWEPLFKPETEVHQAFMNLDKNEPLSYLTSDTLFEVARIKKLNMVACPTDGMIYTSSALLKSKEPKPSQFLSGIAGYDCESELSGGWLTIKSIEPSLTRAERSDRVALAAYLRRVKKEGYDSLDGQASFAFNSGLEYEDHMLPGLLSALGLRSGAMPSIDWDALRLYGSFTPNQRKTLSGEQGMQTRYLQPAQLEILRHRLFDREYAGFGIKRSSDEVNQLVRQYGGIFETEILENEPTEMLPNGLTGQETITLKEATFPITWGRGQDPNRPGAPIMQTTSPDLVARDLYSEENPDYLAQLISSGGKLPKWSEYRLAEARRVLLSVQINPRAFTGDSLEEQAFTDGQWIPYDKLPEEFRNQVDAALRRLRRKAPR